MCACAALPTYSLPAKISAGWVLRGSSTLTRHLHWRSFEKFEHIFHDRRRIEGTNAHACARRPPRCVRPLSSHPGSLKLTPLPLPSRPCFPKLLLPQRVARTLAAHLKHVRTQHPARTRRRGIIHHTEGSLCCPDVVLPGQTPRSHRPGHRSPSRRPQGPRLKWNSNSLSARVSQLLV